MWECSTPFVFVRWGLHTLGRSNSKLYLYNGLTMMAVFFLCRNLLGVGKFQPHAGVYTPQTHRPLGHCCRCAMCVFSLHLADRTALSTVCSVCFRCQYGQHCPKVRVPCTGITCLAGCSDLLLTCLFAVA